MEEDNIYKPKVYTDIFSHYTYIEENWTQNIDARTERIEELTAKKEQLERELEEAKKEFKRLKEEVEKRGVDTSEFSISKQKDTPKVGRNEPCPCGSGKKYKKCCMRS